MALEMCNHTNTEPELKAVNREKKQIKTSVYPKGNRKKHVKQIFDFSACLLIMQPDVCTERCTNLYVTFLTVLIVRSNGYLKPLLLPFSVHICNNEGIMHSLFNSIFIYSFLYFFFFNLFIDYCCQKRLTANTCENET